MKQTFPRKLLADLLQEILGSPPNILMHDILGHLYRHVEPAEAASFLGTTTGQLAQLRTHGGGPKFIKRGRNFVRYRLIDLIEWQERHLVANTAQAQAAQEG